MEQRSNEAEFELLPYQKYSQAISICNNLAMLTSQCSMVVFVQRITILKYIEGCWMKGLEASVVPLKFGVICSGGDSNSLIKTSNEEFNIKPDPESSDLRCQGMAGDGGGSSDGTIIDEQLTGGVEMIDEEDQEKIEAMIEEEQHITSRTKRASLKGKPRTKEKKEKSKRKAKTKNAKKESKDIKGPANDDAVFIANDSESSYKFLCLSCSDVFETFAELKEHRTQAHGSPSSSINNVVDKKRKAFGRKSPAEERGKRPSCPVCGKTFRFSCLVRNHMRTHTGERPFMCTVCGLLFGSKNTLREHIYTHSPNKPHACKFCNAKFVQPYSLVVHVRSCHTGERPYVCSRCGMQFTTATLLRLHGYQHTGERPYRCSSCDRAFCRSVQLRQHMTIHSNQKKFQCDVCNKAFRLHGSLSAHKNTHLTVKPYSCKECGKTFSKTCNMKVHMRTHTGEKPYTCNACGKTFAHRGTLNKHSEMHLRLS